MSTVFISYRRSGAIVHARALFERLSREFGSSEVFIDLEGIGVGVDFVELIDQQLLGCKIMLALIDPEWSVATDRHGQRRLDKSNDFVRIEIGTALRRGVQVVPILIEGAEMPEIDTLPADLKLVTRRNALALDFRHFDTEVNRLTVLIRNIIEGGQANRRTNAATARAAQQPESPPVPPLSEGTLPPRQPPKNEHVEPHRVAMLRIAALVGIVTIGAGGLLYYSTRQPVPTPQPGTASSRTQSETASSKIQFNAVPASTASSIGTEAVGSNDSPTRATATPPLQTQKQPSAVSRRQPELTILNSDNLYNAIVESRWAGQYSHKTAFELRFRSDGAVRYTTPHVPPGDGRWSLDGARIRIEFDKGTDLYVLMQAEITENKMQGTGQNQGGPVWTWTAVKQ